MRSLRVIAFFLALVLAACGSPEPTATPIPPTATPEQIIDVPGPFGDLSELEGTVVVPVPGTLIVPQSLTPGAPAPSPITIDTLTFTQSGGITDIVLMIELHGDGTLIHGDETRTISEDQLRGITTMLDRIDFFGMQGIFVSPGTSSDAYRYTLRVVSPAGSRTITTEDGLTPPELYAVYDAIRSLVMDQ